MLISRVWLESMLADAAASLDDEAFGAAVTGLGLEVEEIRPVGAGLETIVVGRIESVESHPSADRLRVVQLFDGRDTVQVICGAPNVPPPGGRVAFAPVGTTLPGGLEIAAREIRGVPSHGMICAEDELDIGPDADGIMILDAAWEPGARLIDLVPGIVDTLYDLSITPNRPDALGHVGVARDLAVKFRTRLRPPTVDFAGGPEAPALVELREPSRCGRYIGRAFEGVAVGPSPLWLRVRLHRLGLRPINNVVDITNLVLMEWGQPLHAFDRAKLAEGRVVVRKARAQETFESLDGREVILSDEDLVIADADRPQALAGVMGGARSGVEPGATEVLLEAAWFRPGAVRATARRHQFATDSSYRFERGVGFDDTLTAAADRASQLLVDLAGATCIGQSEAVGERPERPEIELGVERIGGVLGFSVAPVDVPRILEGLGVEVTPNADGWSCRPPAFRPDLTRQEDLIEELLRHVGLDDLPRRPTPPSSAPRSGVTDAQRAFERRHQRLGAIVDALVEQGLHEQISMVFASREELQTCTPDEVLDHAVELTNPMRVQAAYLRTHMLPGLMRALAINVSRHGGEIRLFEVGRTYRWPGGSVEAPRHSDATAEVDRKLPVETPRAAVLLSGGVRGGPSSTPAELAQVMVATLQRIGVQARIRACTSRDDRAAVPWLHPGVQGVVETRDAGGHDLVVGRLGEVHPEVRAFFSIPKQVTAFYAEVFIDRVPPRSVVRYEALARFPSTARDVSFDLDATIAVADVIDLLLEAEARFDALDRTEASLADREDADVARLVRRGGRGDVEFVEDYRGEGVAAGRRAVLLRLNYAARHRSVTDVEVQERHDRLIDATREALRALDAKVRTR